MDSFIIKFTLVSIMVSIFELICIQSQYKKIINIVSSLIIISIILYPLCNLLCEIKNIDFETYLNEQQEDYSIMYEDYLKDKYENIVDKQIRNYLKNYFSLDENTYNVIYTYDGEAIDTVNIILKGEGKLKNQKSIKDEIELKFKTNCIVLWE